MNGRDDGVCTSSRQLPDDKAAMRPRLVPLSSLRGHATASCPSVLRLLVVEGAPDLGNEKMLSYVRPRVFAGESFF